MWLFRVFSSALFLAVTVSSIPLAFDVGGKTCGLAFSLSLAAFYFLVSLLKLTTPDRSWFRSSIITIIRFAQWAIILVLLIWSLNRFSVDADNDNGTWVQRTFSRKRAQDSSIQEWLFGRDGLVETVALGNWDRLLRWSTPVFQLAEGFCSLLVIQAAGQITRWLVNRGGRSDSWMVCFVLVSILLVILTLSPDRSPRLIRYYHLQLGIFPLACPAIPRDLQRRRRADRCLCHMRRDPMCLGYRQWPRKPSRELPALRLHRPLHLPDLHRLPALLPGRTDYFTSAGRRLPPSPTHYHGLVHNPHARTLPPPLNHPRSLQRDHRRLQRRHPLRPDLSRLPPTRAVRINTHHPRGP